MDTIEKQTSDRIIVSRHVGHYLEYRLYIAVGVKSKYAWETNSIGQTAWLVCSMLRRRSNSIRSEAHPKVFRIPATHDCQIVSKQFNCRLLSRDRLRNRFDLPYGVDMLLAFGFRCRRVFAVKWQESHQNTSIDPISQRPLPFTSCDSLLLQLIDGLSVEQTTLWSFAQV